MSALGLIINRRGAPVDEESLHQLAAGLAHYGASGHFRAVEKQFGLTIQAFLPGHKTPDASHLIVDRNRTLIGFCGRIDNRLSLRRSMDSEEQTANPVTDAEIAASLYLRDGPAGLDRLYGGFVLVAHHRQSGVTRIVRDPLGDQPFYYHAGASNFVAASEPALVQKVAGCVMEPDSVRITAWLQNTWPAMDRSFFRGVQELRPGHYLEITPGGLLCRQYWQFSPEPELARMDDKDVRERYRATLAQVVADQTSDVCRTAVSLSGGLDSATIAASADAVKAREGFSWSFNNDPDNDEREQVIRLARALDFSMTFIDGSDAYCRFDAAANADGISRNSPHTNTVNRLKQQLYSAARNAGHRVILAGDSADELYLGRHYWLRDLFRHGRSRQGMAVLPGAVSRILRRQADSWLPLRLLAGDGIGFRRHLPSAEPVWLSAFAKRRRVPWRPSPLVPAELHHEIHHDYAVGHYRSSFMTYELEHLARTGIERRCPYRDLRIVKLFLSLPAWHYSLPPRNKVIAREAFADCLPLEISTAPKRGSLSFLMVRAFIQHRSSLLAYLQHRTDWQQYLDRTLVLDALARLVAPGRNLRVPDGVIWNAICLQNWLDLVQERDGVTAMD